MAATMSMIALPQLRRMPAPGVGLAKTKTKTA
jgi:hypothetical protein